jgi:hypothetical protein
MADRMGVGHGGSLRGYEAAMYRLPVEDVDVVVLANRGLVSLGAITDRLASLTLKAYAPKVPVASRVPAAFLGWQSAVAQS